MGFMPYEISEDDDEKTRAVTEKCNKILGFWSSYLVSLRFQKRRSKLYRTYQTRDEQIVDQIYWLIQLLLKIIVERMSIFVGAIDRLVNYAYLLIRRRGT
jgi:hypothetical protein